MSRKISIYIEYRFMKIYFNLFIHKIFKYRQKSCDLHIHENFIQIRRMRFFNFFIIIFFKKSCKFLLLFNINNNIDSIRKFV